MGTLPKERSRTASKLEFERKEIARISRMASYIMQDIPLTQLRWIKDKSIVHRWK